MLGRPPGTRGGRQALGPGRRKAAAGRRPRPEAEAGWGAPVCGASPKMRISFGWRGWSSAVCAVRSSSIRSSLRSARASTYYNAGLRASSRPCAHRHAYHKRRRATPARTRDCITRALTPPLVWRSDAIPVPHLTCTWRHVLPQSSSSTQQSLTTSSFVCPPTNQTSLPPLGPASTSVAVWLARCGGGVGRRGRRGRVSVCARRQGQPVRALTSGSSRWLRPGRPRLALCRAPAAVRRYGSGAPAPRRAAPEPAARPRRARAVPAPRCARPAARALTPTKGSFS